jgi:hypothetical protein
MYLAAWPYDGIAVDGILYPLSCFSALAFDDLIDPGLSGDSLVGIEMPSEPSGQIELGLTPRIVITEPRP